MDALAAYSPDYVTARARFREIALAKGARLDRLELDRAASDGTPLSIDVALFGAPGARQVVVVSSGTHGVEGFYGSAVQLEAMTRPALVHCPDDTAVVMIHAINPFGMDRVRRVNEDNVDLNRNFVLRGAEYRGAPDGYARLDPLLNPTSPPPVFEAFVPRVGLEIARRGMPTLKAAVATGQYDFPEGLFFGGAGPSQSQTLLAQALPGWVDGARRVVHLDLHTGSGKWGTYALCASDPPDSPQATLAAALFGAENVQPLDTSGVLYEIRGVLGDWCQEQVPDALYTCLLAEIGTHNVIEVIGALREENRAWHQCAKDDPRRIRARTRLLEAFCPANVVWRRDMVALGVTLVERARGLFRG